MIIYGDITKLDDIEAIVNASNGIGYMGGRVCVKELHKGVAESIQYVTKGAVEKLAKKECKAHHIFGYAPGEVFVTDAPNMEYKKIIHAVTMRFPGGKAKFETIEKLIPKIKLTAEKLNLRSVAVPLLGTGTGKLNRKAVKELLINNLVSSKVIFYIVFPY